MKPLGMFCVKSRTVAVGAQLGDARSLQGAGGPIRKAVAGQAACVGRFGQLDFESWVVVAGLVLLSQCAEIVVEPDSMALDPDQ